MGNTVYTPLPPPSPPNPFCKRLELIRDGALELSFIIIIVTIIIIMKGSKLCGKMHNYEWYCIVWFESCIIMKE